MARFLVTSNPFFILVVTPRDNLAAIEEAYEDAVVENPDQETALLQIKQNLLSPKARLAAELSWVSELDPKRAEALLSLVRREDKVAILTMLGELPSLARANVAADAVDRFHDPALVSVLAEAHRTISPRNVASWLNATRAAAGFARVSQDQVVEGLRALRDRHAEAAVQAIVARPEPGETLAALLRGLTDPHQSFWVALFRRYDQWSSPHLMGIQSNIAETLGEIMAEKPSTVQRLCEQLKSWSDICRPAQILAQMSGLDEARTFEVYKLVRSTCIDLANEHARYADAEQISTTMRDLFRDLPTAAKQLTDDVATLRGLRVEQVLASLSAAVTEARENLRPTVHALEVGGFGEASFGQVAALRDAFVAAADALRGTPKSDVPFGKLRVFALELSNNHKEHEAALRLLEGAVSLRPPQDKDYRARVESDIRTARNNRDRPRLEHVIAPLSAAVAEARENLQRTVHELEVGGFGEASFGHVAALRDVFVAAADALRGTPQSDAPFRELRAFALELGNNNKEHEAALRLLKGAVSLRQPRDNDYRARVERDIRTVRKNRDHQRFAHALAPLSAAVAEARENLRRTVHELEVGGFGEASFGHVAALRDVFVAATDALRGAPQSDAPFGELRAFALELGNNNEHEATLRLLEGAVSVRPPQDKDVRARVENDIRTARNNRNHQRLVKAMEGKRWNDAQQLVCSLIEEAEGDEQSKFAALKKNIDRQENRRFFKYLAWGAAALFVLYVSVSGFKSQESYRTASPDVAVTAPPDASPAKVATPSPSGK
jgi:hypothetical protein